MRLLDQIIHCDEPYAAVDRTGRRTPLTGLLEHKGRLSQCPVRYVLDPPTSKQCSDLINDAPTLFDPKDPYLRISSEMMWVEMFSDPDDETTRMKRSRLGALVSCDESGRRGEIVTFHDQGDVPHMDRGTIVFDLDRKLTPEDRNTFHIHQGTLSHLNELFDHVLLCLRPEWTELADQWTPRERSEMIRNAAQGAWFFLPVLLAFSAMLNSGGILEKRPSELGKINRARAKSKKRPLLDHTEVNMQLGYSHANLGGNDNESARASPRLHHVRGHVVRRAGMTFWRASHLRGDLAHPILPRTINFRA